MPSWEKAKSNTLKLNTLLFENYSLPLAILSFKNSGESAKKPSESVLMRLCDKEI